MLTDEEFQQRVQERNERTEPGRILGVNVRSYPSWQNPPFLEVTVVLVSGSVGDYAAYVGVGSNDWVRRYGNRLSFEEARCHFPNIEEERYRP